MKLTGIANSHTGIHPIEAQIIAVGVCPNCDRTHLVIRLQIPGCSPCNLTLNLSAQQAEELGAELTCPGPLPVRGTTIPPEALQ